VKRWVSRRREQSALATGAGERAPGAGLVVARNALYNFGSQIWLTLIALVATPYVVHQLGVDGYGLYALVLTVVGYFAFLDLGLSVATVKYLSEYHGRESDDVIRRLIGTTVALYLVLGALGGAVVALSASWLVANVLAVPQDFESLARTSLWIVAAGLALNLPAVAFISVPVALQRMDITGRRNALVGTATTLGTVFVLWLGYGLEEVLVVHVGVGFAATLSWIVTARRLLPATRLTPRFDGAMLRRLTRFGSLKFLQHATTHSILHLDKLLLAALASLSAVGYYAVPLHLAQRILYAVGNVANAAFPAASALHGREDVERLSELYLRAAKLVALLVFPAASMLFLFSHPLLEFWIGRDFAAEASIPLKILAVGYLALSFTTIPAITADAADRPAISAIFSVAGLAINLALSLALIPHYGATGAAVSTTVNACIIGPGLVYVVQTRVLPLRLRDLVRRSLARPAVAAALSWPLMAFLAGRVDGLASLIAGLLVSFAAYLGLSVMLRTYDARDREALRGVWRARGA
jgi:O-antigen/teichoic acid export membrane protein